MRFTLAFLLGIIGMGCSDNAVREEQKLRPIKSEVVKSGSLVRERFFSGVVKSAAETTFSFKVAGTIVSLPTRVGDSKKAGDLLARLEGSTLAAELEQAKADALSANAKRRSAEAEYQRVKQLYANDNASRNELDNALAESESARANYKAAIQKVKLATLNVDYTRLVVLRDCSIAEILVEVNENVTANQTVATASCGDQWEVILNVPESVIHQFSDSLEGFVRFPSLPGQGFKGVVTEIGVGMSDRSTFPVTLTMTNVPTSIRSNLAAEVEFQFFTNDGSNVIYVPPATVAQDQSGTYVYVVNTTDHQNTWRLIKRNVVVGQLDANGLQIVSGIRSGERLLFAGHVNARDGLLVRAE